MANMILCTSTFSFFKKTNTRWKYAIDVKMAPNMSMRDQKYAMAAVSEICQRKYGILHAATAKQKYTKYLATRCCRFVSKIKIPSPREVMALMSAEIEK